MWKLVIFFIFTVLVAFSARLVWNMAYFRIIHNHSPGECKTYQIPGAEDMVILPSGLAIISSGLKYNITPDVDPRMFQRPSAIYGFDFTRSSEEGPFKLNLLGFDASSFNPHGISQFYNRDTEETTIFVINHGNGKTVEIFDLDLQKMSLTHRRTVSDPLIHNPNNLVATGPDSFYLTNDHYFSMAFLKFVEIFCGLPLCDVVYFDGQKARVVATGMAMANGINMSPDEKYVFVASVSSGGVEVFERLNSNNLRKIQNIPVGSVVDNIFVDSSNGHLWLGCVPKPGQFLEYSRDFNNLVASQVLHVQFTGVNSDGKLTYETREPFMNDGSIMKASSSAARFEKHLLIGGVFENIAHCELQYY